MKYCCAHSSLRSISSHSTYPIDPKERGEGWIISTGKSMMMRMLRRAGFKVEVATASGMTIVSPARDLEPDLLDGYPTLEGRREKRQTNEAGRQSMPKHAFYVRPV